MRFKAGIWLIILILLLSIGGCSKPGGQDPKLSGSGPGPEISLVQVPEEVPAAANSASNVTEEKPAATGVDRVGTKDLAEDKTGVKSNEDTAEDKTNGVNTKDKASEDKKPAGSVVAEDAAAEGKSGAAVSASRQVAPAKIRITGDGVKASREYTLDELKQMKNLTVSAKYYSRGSEKPGWAKASHNDFTGVLLYELLAEKAGLADSASRVRIIAEDGYVQVFSLKDLKADYIDETDSSKKLRMIIAWSQDGQEYTASQGAPFRLVMGQQFAGEYNRLKWVALISRIVVE